MPKLKDNTHLLRKPKLPIGWVRNMIEGVHTQQEWQEIVRGLPPQVKVQFLLACQPKALENKGESGLSVTFVLNGVRETKSVPGEIVKALDTHNDSQ